LSTIIPNLVSTIIPVYNRAVLLRDAVQAVLDQTHRPIEVIIVDDGSTDDTPKTIKALVDAYPEIIRPVHQKNGGPGVAREAGRQMVRGEFIQYLDSDDRLLPLKFERQVKALQDNPEAGVCYCPTYEVHIDQAYSGPPSVRTGKPLKELFPALLLGRIWQTSTPLIRRSVSDVVGAWTALRQEEDWEYDSRIAVLGTKLTWIPEFLAAHIHHSGERAGGNSLKNPVKMGWRATAQKLLYQRAKEYGVSTESSEMQSFARSLFLLCRQCGAVGLEADAAELFRISREASGTTADKRLQFACYRVLAAAVGWTRAGRWSCQIDKLRSIW
jgi:glycosyltransferase involved in cell wall biosynthesis